MCVLLQLRINDDRHFGILHANTRQGQGSSDIEVLRITSGGLLRTALKKYEGFFDLLGLQPQFGKLGDPGTDWLSGLIAHLQVWRIPHRLQIIQTGNSTRRQDDTSLMRLCQLEQLLMKCTIGQSPYGGDEHSRPQCRSEEHTSELQSRGHLVCRLLLEKK